MPNITRREFGRRLAGGLGSAAVASSLSLAGSRSLASSSAKERPNILWISCEDIGTHLGCYGDSHAVTPTLDQLANEGVRCENAFTTAGVCAPNRSSIITGVYASTLGTHHMRSGGEGTKRSVKPVPPAHTRAFTEYLREEGYYCTNNAKKDYNFDAPKTAWDESSHQGHWRNRPDKDQPFFAVFNYTGTHEGSIRLNKEDHAERTKRLTKEQRQDPERLELPPYYPDTPLVRQRWADYYELITAMDYWVEDLLSQLREDGLAENTVVFFWSDHGVGLPRAKRWLYDSGTHVPLIVRIPEKYRQEGQGKPGTVDRQMISSIDFAPTVLNLAGLEAPDYMQGQAFLGTNLSSPRTYVYGARDRMDERYDIIRSVRDKRYRYIRNYEPFRPYHQYMNTPEKSAVTKQLHELADAGELPPEAWWFTAEEKPVEELYDLKKDPHEVNNLAGKKEYQKVLKRMRGAHQEWMVSTGDLGLVPEPELVKQEKRLGSRYAMLHQSNQDNKSFARRLQAAAMLAGDPQWAALPMLQQLFKDSRPSIRYWAAMGIGNLEKEGDTAEDLMRQGISDQAAVVRVAAARALLKMEASENIALPVLMEELKSSQEWIRLRAAIVLDSIGDKARPAIPVLREALNDTHNKYVVRVANHALNQMLETNNMVR